MHGMLPVVLPAVHHAVQCINGINYCWLVLLAVIVTDGLQKPFQNARYEQAARV
jgi:hypothetical protein